MRLLHVINSLVVGGAERLLKDTVNGISRLEPGVQQHVVTLYEDGPLKNELAPGVSYHCLKAGRLSLPLSIPALRRYIKENRIDVVHAHLYDAMIIARLATPKKVKFINTYHNGMYNRGSVEYSWKRKMVDQFTVRKRHHPVFVSEAVKRDIQRCIPLDKEGTVIPNFPSPDFKGTYALSNDTSLRLVSVGTLRHPKNHEHSIAVLALLKEYAITLDIYGYGPREEGMKQLIRTSGAAIRIITNTIVTPTILSQYDAYFMPSLNEGMSIALLEAMSCGLPLVLSDISSFRETAGEAALYFRLQNPNSAANTLLHLYKNRELLQDLSLNSVRLASSYSLQNNIRRLFELYTSN